MNLFNVFGTNFCRIYFSEYAPGVSGGGGIKINDVFSTKMSFAISHIKKGREESGAEIKCTKFLNKSY